ncbi:MAG: blue light sensor protein, partial [Gammaproteobacteria bacterium]
ALDKRHQNPLLIDYRIISNRLFSKWSMGYVPESSATRSILLKYSVSQNFEPRHLSGESCLGILTELSQKVVTV